MQGASIRQCLTAHDLGKGLVSPKVGDRTLEQARATAVADFGALRKRAQPFAGDPVLRLGYADVAKGGVPVEFFYPRAWHPRIDELPARLSLLAELPTAVEIDKPQAGV